MGKKLAGLADPLPRFALALPASRLHPVAGGRAGLRASGDKACCTD